LDRLRAPARPARHHAWASERRIVSPKNDDTSRLDQKKVTPFGLEGAAVAGWDGHEVVHAEPGMGPGEEETRAVLVEQAFALEETDDPVVAEAALSAFEASAFGVRYPMIGKNWRANWKRVIPFLAFPREESRDVLRTNPKGD
jgi:hypothetical protein